MSFTTTNNGEKTTKTTLHSVLLFNQPEAHLYIPSDISYLESKFTIEAWIYSTINFGTGIILAEGDNIFYLEDNQLKFQKKSSGETISSARDSIIPNTWNHVAVSKSGNKPGETQLYINGKQNDNQGVISKLSAGKGIYIGVHPSSAAHQSFQGKISEIRLWNIPRSQVDIEKDLHNRLVGNEPGLVGYWSLSENSGNTVYDKTQNAKNGNIYNAVWSESLIPLACSLDPKERLLNSNKIEDYAYLFSKLYESQAPKQNVFFRRGRIWH